MPRDSEQPVPDSGSGRRLKPDRQLVARRLLEARAAADLSQADAGMKAGVSTVTIYRWEKGKHLPTRRTLAALARIYGRTAEWLTGETMVGSGPTWRFAPDPGEGLGSDVVEGVPLVAVAAGGNALAFDETPRSWFPYRRDWLASRGFIPRHCRLVEVLGNSMSPTCSDGSLVMVDVSRSELRHRYLHLMTVPNEGVVVRRAFRDGRTWIVTAEDPAWEPRTYHETWAVHGLVRWVCNSLD